jgi:hypothetical protein
MARDTRVEGAVKKKAEGEEERNLIRHAER